MQSKGVMQENALDGMSSHVMPHLFTPRGNLGLTNHLFLGCRRKQLETHTYNGDRGGGVGLGGVLGDVAKLHNNPHMGLYQSPLSCEASTLSKR